MTGERDHAWGLGLLGLDSNPGPFDPGFEPSPTRPRSPSPCRTLANERLRKALQGALLSLPCVYTFSVSARRSAFICTRSLYSHTVPYKVQPVHTAHNSPTHRAYTENRRCDTGGSDCCGGSDDGAACEQRQVRLSHLREWRPSPPSDDGGRRRSHTTKA